MKTATPCGTTTTDLAMWCSLDRVLSVLHRPRLSRKQLPPANAANNAAGAAGSATWGLPGPGIYYIAVSAYNRDPRDSGGGNVFTAVLPLIRLLPVQPCGSDRVVASGQAQASTRVRTRLTARAHALCLSLRRWSRWARVWRACWVCAVGRSKPSPPSPATRGWGSSCRGARTVRPCFAFGVLACLPSPSVSPSPARRARGIMECGSEASAHAEADASASKHVRVRLPSPTAGEGLGVRAKNANASHAVNLRNHAGSYSFFLNSGFSSLSDLM
jgi:hypothetical protein